MTVVTVEPANTVAETLDERDDGPPGPKLAAIGRYRILEIVGVGGMGIVFSAWDPELERRVAIKLVRFKTTSARDRMLREGQLLARLSHPNVVPVFDVGEVEDQVFLVMEFVRGMTLDAFAATTPSPSRRALLDAYRQAGAGLAAAHEGGIVHRDFKPANAIRGDDARVRVLDFGVAHTGGPSNVAGTPAYMAPEQADPGRALTPAVDQFAFALSLRAAFAANGGVPAWIAKIVERGSRGDPAARYPSMAALLSDLALDPATRWRRRAVVAGLVLASAAAFVIARQTSDSNAIEPCTGGAQEIAQAWNADIATKLAKHLDGLRPTEGTRLAAELTRDAAAWTREHRAACLANERKELSPQLYTQRLDCLTRVRARLTSVVDLLSSVDKSQLDNALLAARARSDIAGCTTPNVNILPPPASLVPEIAEVVPALEHALVLAIAMDKGASSISTRAVARARAIGYGPMLARSLLVHGRALELDRNRSAAAVAYEESQSIALQHNDAPTAVEAYARSVYVLDRTTKEAARIMRPLAASLDERGRFARALLYNNLALTARSRADTLALLFVAQQEAASASSVELISIGVNLASRAPTPQAALASMRVAYERYRNALGDAHEKTVLTRIRIGILTPDRTAARALFDCRSLAADARALCLYESAWLADEDGRYDDAGAAMRFVADWADQIATAYIAMREHRLSSSQRDALERLAREPFTKGEARFAVDAAIILALAGVKSGWKLAEARASEGSTMLFSRRRARIAAALAFQGGSDAPAHARRALIWYGDSPHDADLATRLRAIK